jgi:hypothetical protein
MKSGYNKLFIGTIFVIININVGWVDILPDFIGYIIILYGLSILFKKTLIKDFEIAISISSILLIHSLVYKFYTINTAGSIFVIILVTKSLLKALLIYYNLTGSIKLLENCDDIYFLQRIQEKRDLYFYTLMIITISYTFLPNIALNNRNIIVVIFGIIVFSIYISYNVSLNKLKNYFNSEDTKIHI